MRKWGRGGVYTAVIRALFEFFLGGGGVRFTLLLVNSLYAISLFTPTRPPGAYTVRGGCTRNITVPPSALSRPLPEGSSIHTAIIRSCVLHTYKTSYNTYKSILYAAFTVRFSNQHACMSAGEAYSSSAYYALRGGMRVDKHSLLGHALIPSTS